MIKVSVIIPVYNAEKYIAVCLESLLIQTLKDFEVILVDDCSTDMSPVIAESYLERFGGRMKIIILSENTGGGAEPRNVGLKYARGKYICFVDSDDFLVDNALEELFNLSEAYQAEAVYMDCGYTCSAEPIIPINLAVGEWNPNLTVATPTLETNNLFERVEKFITRQYKWPPCWKFSRREFLIANDIKFPPMRVAEDGIFSFEIICAAKNYLHVPTPLYVQRLNDASVTRIEKTPEQEIIFRAATLLNGADCLEEFMSRIDFFKQNPDLRLQVLMFFLNVQLEQMEFNLKKLKPSAVYEIFLREFSKAGNSHPALTAYLFLMLNIHRE